MTFCNLQEIYSACQSKRSGEPSLVPSLISLRVYHSACGWGRLWKWFYLAARFLTGKDLKTDRLIQVMQKTEETFSRRLPKVVENAVAYQNYLQRRIKEQNTDENEMHPCRKSVRRWTRSTATFAFFVDRAQNEKITSLFQSFYPEELERGERPFSYGENEALLQETQLFIDLEGYLHRPLPIPLLKKLARGIKLTPKEKHELEKWIEILNKKKHCIPVGLFLDCLKILTEKPSFGGKLIDLEIRLLQNNLKLLQMSEPEQLSWRASLQRGDELKYGNHTYQLGEQAGSKDEEVDTNLIFEIEGDQDHVIAIGMNRTYWPVKQQVADAFQWGIKMPEIQGISPDGRFAVIEKLTPAVTDKQWKTPKNQPLIDEDLAVVTPIANLFNWWGRQSICPADFSLRHLMFNKKGELKYTHALQPQPFDFRQLEDLAHEIAQGNLDIYLHIMKQSRLNTHVTMNLYRSIVKAALEGDPSNIKNLAAVRNVTDPIVIRRGRQLYKEIQKLREEIIKTLNGEFDNIDQESLLAEANKELSEQYWKTCSGSCIWPTIKESVTGNLRRAL